jgi:hypothetical protein
MTKPNTVRIKNIASVAVHGVEPGAIFETIADSDGVPLAPLWRKRIADKSFVVMPAPMVLTMRAPVSAASAPPSVSPPVAASSASQTL